MGEEEPFLLKKKKMLSTHYIYKKARWAGIMAFVSKIVPGLLGFIFVK
jgi:hypothetical protein